VNWSVLITHQHWLKVKLQCFGVDLVGYIQEQNRVPIPQLVLSPLLNIEIITPLVTFLENLSIAMEFSIILK
jgi:hypothetical protein